MAVQPQTPYIEHIANGTTTGFNLGFDCDDQDHLIVKVDDVEPSVGSWSLTGSAVVFGAAPTSGKKITIQRNTPFERKRDYQSYDNSFRPPTVNKDFDWIWWKLQELGVADWILGNRITALKSYVDEKDDQLQKNINSLKGYVDLKDDELRAYLMEEIRKQGVALDQLDDYYNYLMQRLAQIAVDKGWDASFVVDGDKTQKQINDDLRHVVKPLRRVRTPEQYGADGTIDGDTAAWVAVCQALQSGEELRACGKYKINGSNVVISQISGFRLDLSGAIFYQQATFSKTIRIENCVRFTVKEAELHGLGGAAEEYNGASTSHNGVAGIFLKDCDYPLIIANKLFDHAGGSIVWRECDHLMFINNTVVGIGPDFIPPSGNGQDFAIGGFSDNVNRMDFVVSFIGNRIKDTAFGFFANRCKSLTVSGNIIERIPGQHGAYIIESSGLVVSGNTFLNCKQSAFKLQLENYAGRGRAPAENLHMSGFSYTGNVVKNCQDGLAILSTSLSDGTDQKVFGLVVSGNIIESTTQDGMTLNHCIDAKVGLNTISGALRFGIQFRNSSGDVSKNTIIKSGSSGIGGSLYDDSDFSDNTIIDCGLNNISGSGGETPIFLEQSVKPLPSAKVNPTAFLDSNRLYFSTGDAISNLIYVTNPYKVSVKDTRTNSKKSVRVDRALLFCEGNDFLGFTASALNNPTDFVAGSGRRQFHGQKNPQQAVSTQAFVKGDICWNTNSGARTSLGWVCAAAGTPGTWMPFGVVGESTLAHQSNSTATDVATLAADINALILKLKSSGLMNLS